MTAVDVQDTPNPRAKRFVVDRPVQDGLVGQQFAPADDVEDELVRAVLAIPGVVSVLTLPSSLTVNVSAPEDWDPIAAQVVEIIQTDEP